jgi:hypothetical protein
MYLGGVIVFAVTIVSGIFLQLIRLQAKLIFIPVIVAWFLAMVGSLRLWYQLRCPTCHGRLGFLTMLSGKAFWKLELLEEYKYCVY